MASVLRPATALLDRLSYARKIVVLTVVMVLPLTVFGWGFVSRQDGQIAVTTLERDGVRYLRPLLEVTVRAVDARDRAVRGSDPAAAGVADIVAQVDAVDGAIGTSLGVSDSWHQARDALRTAGTVQAKAAGLDAWNTAIDQLNTLIAKVSDGSNLTLDPDLDSYYVMDALSGRLPMLLDAILRGADAALLDSGGPVVTDRPVQVNLAISAAHTAPNVAAFGDGMAKAIAATGNATLRGQQGAVGQLTTLVNGIAANLHQAAALGRPVTLDPAVLADVSLRITNLIHVLVPVLDELLVARLALLDRATYEVVALGVVAILLAGYLLIAFWRSATTALGRMVGALDAIADGDLTVRARVDARDEVGRMATALDRALDRVRELLYGLGRGADEVSRCADELSQVNTDLRQAAAGTAEQAATLGSSAAEVSRDVTAVAAGTEQMGAAIREIALGSSEAAQVAGEAVAAASATHETVTRLGRSSEEIGGVVRVITAIAEQTNLLALNATIEAARAGESGKGFAVVANEVKELAQETAKATDDIIKRVEALQADTSAAVTAIEEIANVIGRINDIQATIASAIEEQTATTNEMSRSLGGVAAASNGIAQAAESVAAGADRAIAGASATGKAAFDLAGTADELRGFVNQFRLS